MYRSLFKRPDGDRVRRRRRWPRSRAGGCLLWIVLLVIVVLIILSLMFGGFQKGTKSGGLGPMTPSCTACV